MGDWMPPATSVLEERDLRRPTDAPRRRPLRGRGGASGGVGVAVGMAGSGLGWRSGPAGSGPAPEPLSGVRTSTSAIASSCSTGSGVRESRFHLGSGRSRDPAHRGCASWGSGASRDGGPRRSRLPAPASTSCPARSRAAVPRHPSAAAGVECPRTPPITAAPAQRAATRSISRPPKIRAPDPLVAGGIQSRPPRAFWRLRGDGRVARWRGGRRGAAGERRGRRWKRRRPPPGPGSGRLECTERDERLRRRVADLARRVRPTCDAVPFQPGGCGFTPPLE